MRFRVYARPSQDEAKLEWAFRVKFTENMNGGGTESKRGRERDDVWGG